MASEPAIQEGLNTSKLTYHTLLATLDIVRPSTDFHALKLIEKIYNTNMDIRYKIWLANYLIKRHAYTMTRQPQQDAS